MVRGSQNKQMRQARWVLAACQLLPVSSRCVQSRQHQQATPAFTSNTSAQVCPGMCSLCCERFTVLPEGPPHQCSSSPVYLNMHTHMAPHMLKSAKTQALELSKRGKHALSFCLLAAEAQACPSSVAADTLQSFLESCSAQKPPAEASRGRSPYSLPDQGWRQQLLSAPPPAAWRLAPQTRYPALLGSRCGCFCSCRGVSPFPQASLWCRQYRSPLAPFQLAASDSKSRRTAAGRLHAAAMCCSWLREVARGGEGRRDTGGNYLAGREFSAGRRQVLCGSC